MKKRTIIKEIRPKDIKQEPEGRHKFFQIRYKQMGGVVYTTREYQKKSNVLRILDSPLTVDAKIKVIEIVDDG